MFADAARDGLIASNPFTNLRLETPKGRKDLDALTEPEICDLADAVRRSVSTAASSGLIMFLGYVGCRPGRLCCIRRDDVDVERAECTIRFTVDGEGGEKRPKNGKPRVVTIPPPALEALQRPPPRLDSPYLFHSARGRRLSKGTLSYAFRVVPATLGQARQARALRASPRVRDAADGSRTTAARGRQPARAHRRRRARSAALRAPIQSAGCATRCGWHSPVGERMGSSDVTIPLETTAFRTLYNPPSPLISRTPNTREFANSTAPPVPEPRHQHQFLDIEATKAALAAR